MTYHYVFQGPGGVQAVFLRLHTLRRFIRERVKDVGLDVVLADCQVWRFRENFSRAQTIAPMSIKVILEED